jgi:SAM-dependent methyltransferase
MIELAEKRRSRFDLEIEFLPTTGEQIPLESSSVDTVVSTFTLCTIPNSIEAVRSIRRVLSPSGRLLFFEHLRSPDGRVQRWQRRWEPLHSLLFEGLRLTLDTPELLVHGGLQLEQIQKGYLASFPKSWTYFCWGSAIRPRAQ